MRKLENASFWSFNRCNEFKGMKCLLFDIPEIEEKNFPLQDEKTFSKNDWWASWNKQKKIFLNQLVINHGSPCPGWPLKKGLHRFMDKMFIMGYMQFLGFRGKLATPIARGWLHNTVILVLSAPEAFGGPL